MSQTEKRVKRKIKILLVDPDEQDLRVISNIFLNEGVIVRATNTMEKALKIFNAELPSIVISEYLLGDVNTGVDLLRKIQKTSPDKTIPFILHTNMKNKIALDLAENNGVDACFIKPLDEDGFNSLIKTTKRLIRKYL